MPDIENHQARGVVRVRKPNGVESEKQTVVSELQATEPVAVVGFSMHRTKNLGNYESVRFSVHLSMPSEPAKIDSVFAFARNWVDTQMSELESEINKDVGSV